VSRKEIDHSGVDRQAIAVRCQGFTTICATVYLVMVPSIVLQIIGSVCYRFPQRKECASKNIYHLS